MPSSTAEMPCVTKIDPVALADRERAAHLLLGERAQDHADDHRRRGESVAAHEEADEADRRRAGRRRTPTGACRTRPSSRTPGCRRRAAGAGSQQLHPQAHQRQVQHQQHHVADVEARDQAPHQRRSCVSNSSGPGCRPYCWNAASRIAAVADVGRPEREQRNHRAGGRRVVRGLRARPRPRSRPCRTPPGAW